ncbi:MAG: ABC transporter ATP-binding protein [Oscillospiraceae bacterium]|nr:ABC transporter ATP-binding protein [Oscillospiraceae bacterium]
MTLHFDQVSASYRKKAVLENITFTADSGGITALIGRNGAGKSTLIACLTREKRDYRGMIWLDGQDVRSLSRQQLASRLACLPQNLPRPHVTVRELVAFGRAPYTPITGALSPADREKIDWALNAVGMTQLSGSFVDTLSGGERKKAFFAMTLAQDTPVVVLDEPTAHLDTVSRFAFLEMLEDLRRRTGKTFLVVMHDLTEVFRYAHRVVVIHDKKVAFNGTPGECLAAEIPQTCFQIKITGNPAEGFAAMPLNK